MAMDFPASPTNGQVFTSGGVAYTWNGYAWIGGGIPAAGADAPPDGNEYVRVNGVWRMVKQTLIPTVGGTSIDIAVPSWAKAVEINSFCFATGSNNLTMRYSADGTTFLAGATDYSYGGPYHIGTGAGTFSQIVGTTTAQIPLAGTGDNYSLPIVIRTILNVVRAATIDHFMSKTFGHSYNGAQLSSTTWYHGSSNVAALGLRLAALRLMTAVPFNDGSQIHCRWL
jgi:hypothetical protein